MKQLFKVFLFEDHSQLCETLVRLAAKSNGDKSLSLKDLKKVAESEIILYPTANKDTSVEVIGDEFLHIDRKVGDEWKTVCRIESTLVFEMPKVQETEI